MNPATAAVLAAGIAFSVLSAARADDDHEGPQFPSRASFTTKIITPFSIEGLTGDAFGNLYTSGRPAVGTTCPVWKINVQNPSLVVVGTIPNTTGCNLSGITFDALGNLYVADAALGGVVWKLTPNADTPPVATQFATGVPGTNGLAFDRDGNLWTGDGTTGVGRVWKISSPGAVCEPAFTGCAEVFRIQAMANVLDPATSGGVANVGRDIRGLPPGTIAVTPTSRNASNQLGSQPLVSNGLAFNEQGDLYIADTARGAIWKAEFHRSGALKSRTGCDKTFSDNTLCLDNIFVAHAYLEGTDGIALDRAGNIWNSANERNAIVVVTKNRRVVEVFRNPVNAAGLRNSADPAVGNNRILELPTSPFLLGKLFCTANSDGNRRDNSPNTAGEVGPASPGKGKISCMDQELEIPGLRLPLR
jgi:sugar lactone lactonase YvrE